MRVVLRLLGESPVLQEQACIVSHGWEQPGKRGLGTHVMVSPGAGGRSGPSAVPLQQES